MVWEKRADQLQRLQAVWAAIRGTWEMLPEPARWTIKAAIVAMWTYGGVVVARLTYADAYLIGGGAFAIALMVIWATWPDRGIPSSASTPDNQAAVGTSPKFVGTWGKSAPEDSPETAYTPWEERVDLYNERTRESTLSMLGNLGAEISFPTTKSRRNELPPELAVTVELVPNIGSGATPGTWIRGRNLDVKAARGVAMILTDVLLRDPTTGKFGESRDIHQGGPFQQLVTGTGDLFCNDSQPTDLGFIRYEVNPSVLVINGNRGGGRDACRIRNHGVWRLVGHLVANDGRRRDVSLDFEWDGKSLPKPWTLTMRVTPVTEPIQPMTGSSATRGVV